MKRIVYQRQDGQLAIVTPAYRDRIHAGRSAEDILFLAWTRLPSTAVAPRIVEDTEIPADRTFRQAWTDTGSAIVCDMPKARTIHLDRIRAARQPELDRLDREWMKAVGQKNQAAADSIEAQRQALRDLPQTLPVASAQTSEALKSVWSDLLPKR